MKITTTKAILTTVAFAALALLATSKVEASYLPDVAVAISYLAVGSIFVIAAFDNRRGSKTYLAR
jgi:hypothetical protein